MWIKRPNVTKCCFCFPLRYGLLVWGVINLIMACQIVALVLFTNVLMAKGTSVGIVLIIPPVISLYDAASQVVFIIGVLTKCLLLLELYFWFSIVLIVIEHTVFALCTMASGNHLFFAATILHLVAEAYFLLLVRTEIVKLQSKYQCSLTTPAEA